MTLLELLNALHLRLADQVKGTRRDYTSPNTA